MDFIRCKYGHWKNKATMEFSVKLRKILFPQIFKAKCNP